MEYCLVVKNNDIIKFEGKMMDLDKEIALSEVTQIQKDKHGMDSLISGF